MQFVANANVLNANGETIGEVDRVVIDARSKEITHLVVRKGVLFTEDKILPVDWVVSTDEDRVQLKQDVDLDDLPPFEETYFVYPPSEELEGNAPIPHHAYAPAILWYPAYGAPRNDYPLYPDRPVKTATTVNLPEDSIPLKEGAAVIAADGKKVGDVERVLTEGSDEEVSHFMISKGLLFKQHKIVPAGWVQTVGEDEVRLAVSSRLLERLPDYQE